MVGGFVAVQNRLDFGKETLSCYVEVPDEEQGATELQLLSVRFAPTPPLTASWSAFTSVELLSRVFSLRAQFLVSSASESDFLLPFLNDQQTVTLRFVTPDARALSDLETCLAQHTNDLPCSVQHVTPSAVRGQPVVVSNSRGELSLSQTVRGCKSSVVAMKQEGKKEPEGTLFSSTPLLEPVVVKEDEKVGDSMRKEDVSETPEVTVVKETQDPPLDPTPLLKESKPWICFVPITHSEAKSPLRRSASIDTLSSLHSTPKKPAKPTEAAKPVKPVKSGMSGKVPESETKEASAQVKSFTPVRQTEKPAEAPVPKAMTKAVATQMAGLSRRKGMSFLSQLMGEEKETKEVKREVKKEVKKEYRRKWQMPSKPSEEEEKEEKEKREEKKEIEEKEEKQKKEEEKEKEKKTQQKQEKEEAEKKKQEPQTTRQLEEPEKVEIEGEKVTLPRKRTTRKPQQKRAAPQAQTAGRKKARVETPPPPIETKPAPEADSDFSSSSEDIDTTQLMDTVKSLLSTPKVRVQSTDSTPSSNGSESEDEDPGLLAMQQMMTGG